MFKAEEKYIIKLKSKEMIKFMIMNKALTQVYAGTCVFDDKDLAEHHPSKLGCSNNWSVEQVIVKSVVVPDEHKLIEYYNNEENQEWLNAPLGKPKNEVLADGLSEEDFIKMFTGASVRHNRLRLNLPSGSNF